MQRVVDVVGPLRVEAEAARRRAAVTVRGSLRSDSAISQSGRPSRATSASTSSASSSSSVHRAVVEQRVHGVEPQPVDVEVAQPHDGVVDDEAAHLVAARRRRG